ncbi:hypothetical protein [Nocardioides sp.]|uniref:hypothetical protein n=1 Tax=Nocardioides sp. TaxID=35761 RepID=UPI002BF6B4AF|nr:hypothetical protein [Nocardioides sp.]HSX67125.1 hypothetical protein [Nocardioides sp.]
MSTITATEELQVATRIIDSAGNDLNRAVDLLDRVSESLADQLISTLSLLDDCNDRVKRTLRRLEEA